MDLAAPNLQTRPLKGKTYVFRSCVGLTGPVDVSSLSLYGEALDVAPSVRPGMEVRD